MTLNHSQSVQLQKAVRHLEKNITALDPEAAPMIGAKVQALLRAGGSLADVEAFLNGTANGVRAVMEHGMTEVRKKLRELLQRQQT
jgi:hypothetical protein